MNPLVESRSGGTPPADEATSFVARLSFSGANSTERLGYLARRLETISPPTSLSNGNVGLPQMTSLALIAGGGRGASPPRSHAVVAASASTADDPMTVRRVAPRRIRRTSRKATADIVALLAAAPP